MMTLRNKSKIFGWFAATVLLLTTSCKDDTFNDFYDEGNDEVTVEFTLTPEALATSSRAIDDETYVDYSTNHISDGSKADMLIYAVYDEEGNLLEGYTSGSKVPGFDHGDGQTILPVDQFPFKLNIVLKRNATYTIAFWAQSSNTKAYNTSDLRKIEVNYSEVDDSALSGASDNSGSQSAARFNTTTPNNDEYRDAFCRSITISTAKSGTIQQNVYLYRPLAQINVGTSGFDYEIISRNAQKKYTYSKIRVNRVARYLDVVDDVVLTSTTESSNSKSPEAFSVVDFGYAKIPAYFKMDVPAYPSYTRYDWSHDADFVAEGTITNDNYMDIYGDEEFLKVKLYDHEAPDVQNQNGYTHLDSQGEYLAYASFNNHEGDLSETFKYLSMCYVLTSSSKEEPIVINNVKVWLATDDQGADEVLVLDMDHVPAQRNWRTNIVGNLLTSETVFDVKLDKDFAGEYNGWQADNEWEWSGMLHEGAYYDAKNDVIEISSAEGLLWFQRMVNGDIKVRENGNASLVGKDFVFYKKNPANGKYEENTFKYNGISKPTDDKLAERIMRATHQFANPNSMVGGKAQWPTAKNFHFTGKDAQGKDWPATVKLMADIDLSGMEWIPIGFEGRIEEQMDYSKELVADSKADNRIFYGIFDGNGHTITGLSTKRFSANVHKNYHQIANFDTSSQGRTRKDNHRPVDNPQWWGRGLFGQIGGNAKIRNVRMRDVNIYGCNGVGGVVGIAYGDTIEITNCIVDGGSIKATPLFRGDTYSNRIRTFARGVYTGGIVGYFYTDGGRVDNNEVRNIFMEGTRRVGGIVGSINQSDLGDGTNELSTMHDVSDGKQKESNPASISYNHIFNTVIIASEFTVYGMALDITDGVIRAGFGYNKSPFYSYSQKFVGGHVLDYDKRSDLSGKCVGNTESGLTFADFPVEEDKNNNPTKHYRLASLTAAPLKNVPMLSSWYADSVILKANFFGEPSAYTRQKLELFNMSPAGTNPTNQTGYSGNIYDKNKGWITNGGNTYYVPFEAPYETEVNWDTLSYRAGMYVESVRLDGKGGIGGRSVLTVKNVTKEGDCAMYVTARNRYQFVNQSNNFKQPTIVKNMVIRGEPYASTGVLVATNKNMLSLTLDSVAIYDVYRTIAMDYWADEHDVDKWPNTIPNTMSGSTVTYYNDAGMQSNHRVPLYVKNSNLRGYTVPGGTWQSILFQNTTFEQGTYVGRGDDEFTCKIETPDPDPMESGLTKTNVTFDHCYFKAPYIVDLSEADINFVKFIDSYATSTAPQQYNAKIELPAGCKGFAITSNAQGVPVVKYYNAQGEEIK